MTPEEMRELIQKIEQGDLDYVTSLLARDPACLTELLIDRRWDGNKRHAIHYACSFGQLDIVCLFLEKNPELLEAKDYKGTTPIFYAIAENQLSITKALVTYGANTVDNYPSLGINIIHMAAFYGHLDIIHYFVEKDPALLDKADNFNQTPLMWAARMGHVTVVDYLLSKNANTELTVNRPGAADHDNTALMVAIANYYFDVACSIIIKKTASFSEESILKYVTNGQLALFLMILNPGLIGLFMRNVDILRFFKKPNFNIREGLISHYQPATKHPPAEPRSRRGSFFVVLDTNTGVSKQFIPTKTLGKGSFGLVRLFEREGSEEGSEDRSERFAVKSFVDTAYDPTSVYCGSPDCIIQKELDFNRRAYPGVHDRSHSKYISFFEAPETPRPVYTGRYVMPVVAGKTAGSLIPDIDCSRQLAVITLNIAQELQRIHDLDIIHGDLNFNNIIIDPKNHGAFIVRMIDFGHAYGIGDHHVQPVHDARDDTYFPPERLAHNRQLVCPNTNQDVYVLGFMLGRHIYRHGLRHELISLFPSIETFIIKAVNHDPSARPSLASLIDKLTYELGPPTQIDVAGARVLL